MTEPSTNEPVAYGRRYIDGMYGAPTDQELAELLLRRVAGLNVNVPQEADTPRRFVAMLRELTTREPFKFTTFAASSHDMVIVRDITFVSLCRHHLLLFEGVAHVGYVPNRLMAGLSKLARCVRYHAKGLQTQEELTSEITDDLEETLRPMGTIVAMEAIHSCMTARGVQAPGTKTYTCAVRGVFADHTRTAKAEFLARINGR